LMVGIIVGAAGTLRMGWIANLLSVPVTTGFLAGIAVHIAASQLPSLFGVTTGASEPLQRAAHLVSVIDQTNPLALGLGIGVLALTMAAEKINAKIPGALIGVVLAAAAVFAFGLRARGVAVLGAIPLDLSHLGLPAFEPRDLLRIAPLAIIISLVIMVQTAATTRSFPSSADAPPEVDRDFIGVGAGCILSGLAGGFPVNASPPRTAVCAETGARSQATGLVAAALVGGLAVLGTGLLAYVPTAALSGVLLFVAQRITRVAVFATVFRESKGEFGLMIVTVAAIVILPIETGVGLGIILSLFHGLWTATRTRLIEFEHVPGTSIWWPKSKDLAGENLPGILVVAFQAPLSFLNAYDFRSDLLAAIEQRAISLVVLEAGSIAELDFTAALILAEVIRRCRDAGATFAIARLESVRAQDALIRFGVTALLGPHCQFRSVDDAIRALAPGGAAPPR
jgi:SulP family sulfate permease